MVTNDVRNWRLLVDFDLLFTITLLKTLVFCYVNWCISFTKTMNSASSKN